MKHTKHCTKCNKNKPLSEYQKYIKNGINIGQSYCRDCRSTYKARIESYKRTNPKNNPNRMFVNGKYIPKTHPLYKPGNYKTFEGAAFASLEGYEKSTEGYVYIICNPCWSNWVKVGMAVDAEDRCNQYQTSSPHRDYKLCYNKYFKDRRSAEKKVHEKLKKISTKYKGEWFKISVKEAKEIVNKI